MDCRETSHQFVLQQTKLKFTSSTMETFFFFKETAKQVLNWPLYSQRCLVCFTCYPLSFLKRWVEIFISSHNHLISFFLRFIKWNCILLSHFFKIHRNEKKPCVFIVAFPPNKLCFPQYFFSIQKNCILLSHFHSS